MGLTSGAGHIGTAWHALVELPNSLLLAELVGFGSSKLRQSPSSL
jgi:hypothetical protein